MTYEDFMKKTGTEAEAWSTFVSIWSFIDCYGTEKYFHWYSLANKYISLLNALKIEKGKTLKTLDISTGIGFLPFALKVYGHNTSQTEIKDEKSKPYYAAHKVLGLNETIPFSYKNKKYNPLPESFGKYDLITAIAVSPMSFFTKKEWVLFINDCMNHLNNNGRIIISPNKSQGEDNLLAYLAELQTFGLFYFEKNTINTPKLEAYEIIKI